ncbi:acyl dehydratase [Halobacteriales archaeon QS_8_69_26]|nr:MAG: acyl dehydratase [Halobacteriales archaeon QS_8_69_26]
MTNHADHITAMTDAWTRLTGSVLRGAMAANTAALSAMETATEPNEGVGPSDAQPGVDSVLYDDGDWLSRRSVETRDEITVGDSAVFEKTLTEENVRAFADASGDTNRLHLDDEFAEGTRFGGRIVHGTLVSGLISAALARLPGVTIYLSQDMEFRAPVSIGDRVRATVEVVEDLGNDQFRLKTLVTGEDGDRTLIDGEAVVIIDDVPE